MIETKKETSLRVPGTRGCARGQDVTGPTCAPWLRGRPRSLLRLLVDQVAEPGIVSLAGGLPAVDLFPSRLYGALLAQLLADQKSMQYGPSDGQLEERVVELMLRRGVACKSRQILLTTGAQQALAIAVRAFVAPGECVVVERFIYAGVRDALAPVAPRLIGVSSSLDDGIDVEALERHLLAGARPRLVYVIPDAHNPLGVSMAAESRERLVALAHDYDFVILEDDPYGLLCCDGEFDHPLAARDSDRVVYVGSFSKILAPALRLGWLRLPPALVDSVRNVKESCDLECSKLTRLAVARLFSEMDFDRHLELLRSTYRQRRNAMLKALADHLPEGCAFSAPAGGMFVWVELPEGTDGEELLRRTLSEGKVAFVPAVAFADPRDRAAPTNAARLSFSSLEPEALRDAVATFAACI